MFAFERGAGVPSTVNADHLLRQAMLRWRGVEVVDPFALTEAIEERPERAISASRARALALRLRAGRYIRGTLTWDGASVHAHAMLFDVSRRESPLFEATGTAVPSRGALEGAFATLADQLLLRPEGATGAGDGTAATSSLPARQAYLRGTAALERWQLEAADSSFNRATNFDARFAPAALWLALTRVWAGRDSATWYAAIEAAAAGRAQLSPSDRSNSMRSWR